MQRFYFILFLLFAYPLSWLPLFIHRSLANILCFVLYRIVGYRKDVVHQNLINSFPSKTTQEIETIEKKFYLNLSDIFMESFKMISISKSSFKKQLITDDASILNKHYKKNQSVILATGHFGSWEMASGLSLLVDIPCVALFRKIKNPYINNFIKKNRARNGFELVGTDDTSTSFEKKKDHAHMFAFIGDQSPSNPNKSHWNTFLTQDTAWLKGIAKYAKQYNYPIVFGYLIRYKRNHYKAIIEELIQDPDNHSIENIIDIYSKKLEQIILSNPDQYLWTHRRWKHQLPTSTNQ